MSSSGLISDQVAITRQRRYYCKVVGCSRSYGTIGCRDRHAWAAHGFHHWKRLKHDKEGQRERKQIQKARNYARKADTQASLMLANDERRGRPPKK